LLRTPSTGEKFPFAFLICTPESLRQTRSRFGTQRKREGGIGVVKRMMANTLRKPMKVRLRGLGLAPYLPAHDESTMIIASPSTVAGFPQCA
jgi:hypothetical protein